MGRHINIDIGERGHARADTTVGSAEIGAVREINGKGRSGGKRRAEQ